MGTYTCYMRNLNHWTCFKIYKAEVENQQNRKIKAVSLTVVLSTMADMTDQVDVHDLLPIF